MAEAPASLIRAELARMATPQADLPAGRKIGALPDGPVQLQVLVFADDGELMGAAPVTSLPRWLWHAGRLCISYSPVHIRIARPGRYSTALICAASPQTGAYQPLWPVSLGEPGKLRAGDDLTIAEGMIELVPVLPGPHG